MHDTALDYGKVFFQTYVGDGQGLLIVDIGAQDVNGSLRSFAEGKGVDVVITDPYSLPFQDGSVDICLSSSCFEHSEFFWLTFLEILRILKPDGLLYLNAPSNGPFHRYPVDCWRFYPDSGIALQNWAQRNGNPTILLESFTGTQKQDVWNDFIAVFLKDSSHIDKHDRRIQQRISNYTNGILLGREGFSNPASIPEDQKRLSLSRISLTARQVRGRLRSALRR